MHLLYQPKALNRNKLTNHKPGFGYLYQEQRFWTTVPRAWLWHTICLFENVCIFTPNDPKWPQVTQTLLAKPILRILSNDSFDQKLLLEVFRALIGRFCDQIWFERTTPQNNSWKSISFLSFNKILWSESWFVFSLVVKARLADLADRRTGPNFTSVCLLPFFPSLSFTKW